MPADDRARKDYEFYENYRDDTTDWRVNRDKMVKFAAGAQYHKKNSEKMEAREQVDIVVNKIRPLIKMRTSLMTANKPTGHIYGVHEEDSSNAAMLGEFTDWHWYNSDGQIKLIRTVSGQNKVGVHYLLLYSDNQADYGRGELRITDVSYRNIFLDKGAKEWDFSDAPRIIHTQLVRPEDFYMRNEVRKDESLLLNNDEIYWDGRRQHKEDFELDIPQDSIDSQKWIRELDVYERYNTDVDVIIQKSTGQIMRIVDDDGLDEQEKILLKKNLTEEDLASVGIDPESISVEMARMEEKTMPIQRIKYRKSASGRKNVGTEEILPISDYPIVPVIDEDTGNAMPMGEVDHQFGIQELLNSCVSLTLLNAALGSNLRILYDPAQMDISEDEFNQLWAVPGGKIPVKRDPVTGKWPVEVIRPEQLNQAWFTLAQMLSQEIEFQISTFSLRTGDPSDAPETFAATLQLGQWAQDILRIPLTYLESALQKVFNVLLEWIPDYYTFEKFFYVVGDHGEPITKVFNPVVLNNAALAYNSIGTKAGISAKYRIRSGSTMPSQSVAELSILQSMAQLNPALLPSVIDRMPGMKDKEKQEIKKRLDKVLQLTAENENHKQTIEALQKELSNINQQNLAMQRSISLSDFETKLKVAAAKELEKMKGNNK